LAAGVLPEPDDADDAGAEPEAAVATGLFDVRKSADT